MISSLIVFDESYRINILNAIISNITSKKINNLQLIVSFINNIFNKLNLHNIFNNQNNNFSIEKVLYINQFKSRQSKIRMWDI